MSSHTPQLDSSPALCLCSKEKPAWQQRPSTAKNNKRIKKNSKKNTEKLKKKKNPHVINLQMGKLRLRQLAGIHESTQLVSFLFLSLRLSHVAAEHSKRELFQVPASSFQDPCADSWSPRQNPPVVQAACPCTSPPSPSSLLTKTSFRQETNFSFLQVEATREECISRQTFSPLNKAV